MRERALIAIGGEPDIGMRLKDTQSEIKRYLPTGAPRSRKLEEEQTRGIVDRSEATMRCASDTLIPHMSERAPPYEKRPDGDELWRGVIETRNRASLPLSTAPPIAAPNWSG